MNQTARNTSMETDPMGDMFSQMFDRMKPQEPANTTPTMGTDMIRLEAENRELERQIAELRDGNSTLSSENRELRSTNQRLLSANRTLRKQLSELNETSRLLEETKRREHDCAEKEEHCRRILNREATLKQDEARLESDRAKLDGERKRLRENIAEQVRQQAEQEQERLRNDADRQRGKDRRVLFALCVGVCASVIPLLVIIMQGRWHALMASLPEWVHARGQQLSAIGKWFNSTGTWIGGIIPQGWWNRPLTLLVMLVIFVIVCGIPLLVVIVYAAASKAAVMYWWREQTMGVHIILWTLLMLICLVVADRLATIPDSPMRWPTWWILLAAITHPVYLLAIAPRISQFIKGD